MSDNLQGASDAEPTSAAPKWKPIRRELRRVLGVLVEKAKTTPDQYPLSLNALTNGCNQKSNRDPQMNLETHQVEDALEELRGLGASLEVVGGGRVSKYRHMMYEWMGVEKAEAAVMAELLLRGSQTLGELRGRAARMEPIADVASLRPIVQSLIDKGLVISLTPPGRGQIVTHALYLPEELEKVQRTAGAAAADVTASVSPAPPKEAPAATPRAPAPAVQAAAPPESGSSSESVQQLRRELEALKNEVTRLKSEVDDIWSNLR
jgi:uncharacterized protein YceH (UPF0502 family)